MIEEIGEILAAGHHDDQIIKALESYDPADLEGVGLYGDIARMLDLLRRSPETRLRAELAQDAGISYSMALDRWADPEDLAMALATRILHVEEETARCPSCGIDPADMWDHRGRPLKQSKYKFHRGNCMTCFRLKSLRDRLSEQEKDNMIGWTIRPREPGDPFEDQ